MAGDPLAARLAEIAVAPDADRHRLRQRCVEAFAADARYRGDERFARVWLALAAASPDPGAVFDAMARHRVGASAAQEVRLAVQGPQGPAQAEAGGREEGGRTTPPRPHPPPRTLEHRS